MPRKKEFEAQQDLNLRPAMNLILILIPLLLGAMETVKIGVLNVAMPQIGPSSTVTPPEEKPDEKPLKLTVAMTDRGLFVYARDQVIENKDDPLGPTFPKTDGQVPDASGKMVAGKVHDFPKLQELLADMKKQNPTEENIIIQGEAVTKFKDIIELMDATRERAGKDAKKEILFPNVVFSAGVA